jgi:hypothetical protein
VAFDSVQFVPGDHIPCVVTLRNTYGPDGYANCTYFDLTLWDAGVSCGHPMDVHLADIGECACAVFGALNWPDQNDTFSQTIEEIAPGQCSAGIKSDTGLVRTSKQH